MTDGPGDDPFLAAARKRPGGAAVSTTPGDDPFLAAARSRHGVTAGKWDALDASLAGQPVIPPSTGSVAKAVADAMPRPVLASEAPVPTIPAAGVAADVTRARPAPVHGQDYTESPSALDTPLYLAGNLAAGFGSALVPRSADLAQQDIADWYERRRPGAALAPILPPRARAILARGLAGGQDVPAGSLADRVSGVARADVAGLAAGAGQVGGYYALGKGVNALTGALGLAAPIIAGLRPTTLAGRVIFESVPEALGFGGVTAAGAMAEGTSPKDAAIAGAQAAGAVLAGGTLLRGLRELNTAVGGGPWPWQDALLLPSGQRVPVTFRLDEAGALRPSHNPTSFTPTPDYPLLRGAREQQRASPRSGDPGFNPWTDAQPAEVVEPRGLGKGAAGLLKSGPSVASDAPAVPVEPPATEQAPAGGFRQRAADLLQGAVNRLDPNRAAEMRRAASESRVDPRTGLGNAWAFAESQQNVPEGHVWGSLDLRGLKATNDYGGRDAGNALIREMGDAAKQAADEAGIDLQHVSTPEGDEVFARGTPEQVQAWRERVHEILPNRTIPGTPFEAGVRSGVGRTPTEAADAANAAKATEVNRFVRPDLGGNTPPPTNIVRMPTADIHMDPARFQFKQLGSEGVSGELKGVQKFNEQIAGVISVWRDPADGKVYVVNGHHRLDLAQRLGHPDLNVQFLDAPDAVIARAEGAFMNIAEGRGTATDVAKFLRDMQATPADLESRGVSVRGDLARDGVALSRLAPDVFDQVATAKVPQGWGVAIGQMTEDPVLQRETLKAVRNSGKRLTNAEVTEVARQVRDAGTEATTQESLFGTETERHGLFVQRAQLAAQFQKLLSTDTRLFGFVAKEGRASELARAGETNIDVGAARGLADQSARGQEMFDRLYTRSGPIADVVNEGARRMAHGEKASSLARELYPRIADAVERETQVGAAPGARPDGGERPRSQVTRSVAGALADEPGSRGNPGEAYVAERRARVPVVSEIPRGSSIEEVNATKTFNQKLRADRGGRNAMERVLQGSVDSGDTVLPPKVVRAFHDLDNLGFDNSEQAVAAVLQHADWRTRWDASQPGDAVATKIIGQWKAGALGYDGMMGVSQLSAAEVRALPSAAPAAQTLGEPRPESYARLTSTGADHGDTQPGHGLLVGRGTQGRDVSAHDTAGTAGRASGVVQPPASGADARLAASPDAYARGVAETVRQRGGDPQQVDLFAKNAEAAAKDVAKVARNTPATPLRGPKARLPGLLSELPYDREVLLQLKREARTSSIVGKKLTTVRDFAVAAQIWRDPRIESFRVILTKGENREAVGGILLGTRLSQGRPGTALAFLDGLPERTYKYLEHLGKELGADGYYQVHNHPTGHLEASSADHKVTAMYEKGLHGRLKFHGHVVTNEENYALIDVVNPETSHTVASIHKLPKGAVRTLFRPRASAQVVTDHWTGALVAAEAKALQRDPTSVMLFLTNGRGEVQSLHEMPLAAVTAPGAAAKLRRAAQETGSMSAFAVIRTGASPRREPGPEWDGLKALANEGVLTDVFGSDPTGATSAVEDAWAPGMSIARLRGEWLGAGHVSDTPMDQPQQVRDTGASYNEAARQSDLFGADELVGPEQTSLLPEDAGKRTLKMRGDKLTAEEMQRRGVEDTTPPGDRPLALFEPRTPYDAIKRGIRGERSIDRAAAEPVDTQLHSFDAQRIADLLANDPPTYLNMDKTGLGTEANRKLAEEVARVGPELQGDPRRTTTFKEWQEAAGSLGLHDLLERDWQHLTHVELLATRNLVAGYMTRLMEIEPRLSDPTLGLSAREHLLAEQRRLVAVNDVLLRKLIPARTEASHRLHQFKIAARLSLDPTWWHMKAADVKGSPLTDEEGADLRRLLGLKDHAGLIDFISHLRPAGFWEKAVTYWKANLLSSPKTHAVNMAANVALELSETLKDVPGAVGDQLLSLATKRRTLGAPTMRQAHASWQGARAGLGQALLVMQGVSTPEDLVKYDFDHAVHFDNPILEGLTQGVFRLLSAEDRVFRVAALYRSLMNQAELLAKAEGLSGKQYETRVQQISTHPTLEMSLRATADAEQTVVQDQTNIGLAMASFSRLKIGPVPLGEFVIPFRRTPGAVLTRLGEYTFGLPATLAQVGAKAAAGTLSGMPADEQREIAKLFGRGMTGAALIALGYYLTRRKILTPPAPDWKTDRAQAQTDALRKVQGSSLVLGDTQIDVGRLSPVGNLLMVGALTAQAAQDADVETSPWAALATGALSTVAKQPFLQGVQQLQDALDDPARAGQRWIGGVAGGFVPLSALLGGIARAIDPTVRETSGIPSQIEARIPVLSKRLPARRDALGNIETREGGLSGAASQIVLPTPIGHPVVGDPVLDALGQYGVTLSDFRPKKGESREMFEARAEVGGQLRREAIDSTLNDPEFTADTTSAWRQELLDRAKRKAATRLSDLLRQSAP